MPELTGETLNLFVIILLAVNSFLIMISGWLFKAWINSIKTDFIEIIQSVKESHIRLSKVEQRCAFIRGKLDEEHGLGFDNDSSKH